MHLLAISAFLALGAVLVEAQTTSVETSKVLIGKALEKERYGLRRGEVSLVLSIWHPDRFAIYDAGGGGDPRGWSVQYEDIGAYGTALALDLEDRRYDVARTTIFALVRESAAFVATTDSGFVISRKAGTKTPFKEHRLWFFEQGEEKDEWLATGLVTALGDSTSGSYDGPTTSPDRDVMETLLAEASEWQDGDAGGAIGHLSDGYVGWDCYDKFAPASWLIVFANPTELQEWLSRRLELTRYTINRDVIHTSVGENGREALALTQDDMSTSYVKGTVVQSAKAYVLWTLSRRGGDWEITRKLFQFRIP